MFLSHFLFLLLIAFAQRSLPPDPDLSHGSPLTNNPSTNHSLPGHPHLMMRLSLGVGCQGLWLVDQHAGGGTIRRASTHSGEEAPSAHSQLSELDP